MSGLYIDLFGSTAKVHSDDLDLVGRHLRRPGTVLDLGCGPGHYTGYLRSLGVEAVGIDMVPEFVEHARRADPDGDYRIGEMRELAFDDRTVAGILVWYSLIHLPPPELDGVLRELRRVLAPGGVLVAGFFRGEDSGDGRDGGNGKDGREGKGGRDVDGVEAFEHKVITAYRWPMDVFAERLSRAGFTEVERQSRPAQDGRRTHAALVAQAGA